MPRKTPPPTFTVPAKAVWQIQCGKGLIQLTAMAPYPADPHTLQKAKEGDQFAINALKRHPWLRGSPQTYIKASFHRASGRVLDRMVERDPQRLIDGRQTYMTFAGTPAEIIAMMKKRRCRLLTKPRER